MTDAYVGRHHERKRITPHACAAVIEIAETAPAIVSHNPAIVRHLFDHRLIERTHPRHRAVRLTQRGRRLLERLREAMT